MVRRAMVVAAWSVLAFLLFSKNAVASVEVFHLNHKDAFRLLNHMNTLKSLEITQDNHYAVKRYLTSDKAIEIICSYPLKFPPQTTTRCAVHLDPALAQKTVTSVELGYVAKSFVFKIQKKSDVQLALKTFVESQGAFNTTESALVNARNKVPRFRIDCPRDWVFDVIECTGHIIKR